MSRRKIIFEHLRLENSLCGKEGAFALSIKDFLIKQSEAGLDIAI